MGEIVAILDMQFGSTGKGQIAGSLAQKMRPDTVATAWGPNAGHTFRSKDFKMVTTMLATAAIAPSIQNILIGPGSIIKMSSLFEEIMAVAPLLRGKTLIIHPQAMVWRQEHAEYEARNLLRVGSTMKGTGEALVSKIRRLPTATAAGAYPEGLGEVLGIAREEAGLRILMDSLLYDRAIDQSQLMFVEGAQGFSLGIHTDFYPHCTSRDVSTAQLLADCRIPFPRDRNMLNVIGVCRTYPIRVANRFDEQGNLVGTSGACYYDQTEMQWSQIGRQPELTTVTKLPRRLFTFSTEQLQEAVRIIGPDQIALTFCDYLEPPDADEGNLPRMVMPSKVIDLVSSIEWHAREMTGAVDPPLVEYFSFGPTMEDVYVRDDDFVFNHNIHQLIEKDTDEQSSDL